MIDHTTTWSRRYTKRPGKRRKNHLWYTRYGTVPTVPCHWCQQPLTFKQATVEHLLAKSMGGTEDHDNLTFACYRCNHSRRDGRHSCSSIRRRRSLTINHQPPPDTATHEH